MAKLAFTLLVSLTLHGVLSYYNQPLYPARVVYRHAASPFQPPAPYMSPVPQPFSYAVPVVYSPPPSSTQIHMGAARPVPFYAPVSFPPPMSPTPYIPSASHPPPMYSSSHMVPRYPMSNMFNRPYEGPKSSIFTKIKPYLFGGTGPRSLPHHPYFPNVYYPHHFSPNRPLQNRPSAHHSIHAAPPSVHHGIRGGPQKSCSCSLHVGKLTVYKHTDMRSSYSCDDIKDCNSFCTNLFSSEDLRAQTRADACLIIGKDVTVPWFRRDHVCEPHGVKNDTKLSVDLCCKNLQPC